MCLVGRHVVLGVLVPVLHRTEERQVVGVVRAAVVPGIIVICPEVGGLVHVDPDSVERQLLLEVDKLADPPVVGGIGRVQEVGEGYVVVGPDDTQHDLGVLGEGILVLDRVHDLVHPLPLDETGILEYAVLNIACLYLVDSPLEDVVVRLDCRVEDGDESHSIGSDLVDVSR